MSWPLAPISEFCTTSSGGTPSRKKAEYYGGDIPWVKSGDLREKEVVKVTEYITDLGVEKSSAKIVKKGAILLAMYGATVGRMAMLGIDASTNQAVCSIRPDDSKAFPKYVYYALREKVPEFLKSAVGGAQPNISQGMIKDTRVLLPSLEEQKRIAAILDKADAIRRKRQQSIELADQLLRSVFLDMFGDPVTNPKGWVEETLVNLVSSKLQNGAYYPQEQYSDEGTEMVHMGDAFYDVIKRGELKRVLVSDSDLEKYKLTSDDLMISRRSLTYEGAAKPSLIPPSSEPLIFESSMIRLTPDNGKVLTHYLFYYLSYPSIKTHFVRKYVTGATIKGISQKNLENIRILVPPLDMQKKFVDRVVKIGEKVEKLKHDANVLDMFFSSLIQQAFNGKLIQSKAA